MAKPAPIKRSITLFKPQGENANNETATKELTEICGHIINPTRQSKGWTAKVRGAVAPKDGKYEVGINLICTPLRTRKEDAIDQDMNGIVEQAQKSALRRGWQICAIGDEKVEIITQAEIKTGKATVYADVNMPEDWRDHFSHLFDRDPHIERIMSAVQASVISEWEDRLHCALIGPPAAGKSELLECLRRMLGHEAVEKFDATATTQAGAIRDLAQREVMPRILIIEEIEKVDESMFRWLLGAMDSRAEIRKNTARSQINKEVKFLVLATVNDFGMFKKMLAGALSSRFVNKIYCGAPGRELLKKILLRDVAKMKDGKIEWVEPALEFALQNGINDPREVLSILKCGREELMTGVHQKRLLATMVEVNGQNNNGNGMI